ncbi:unnamed protein product, partial [Gulo gulo]
FFFFFQYHSSPHFLTGWPINLFQLGDLALCPSRFFSLHRSTLPTTYCTTALNFSPALQEQNLIISSNCVLSSVSPISEIPSSHYQLPTTYRVPKSS